MKLFAAIALDAQTRARFSEFARALREAPLAARYVPEENYHVTVAYLGAVDAHLLEPVQAALREAAAAGVPFALTFDRTGAFPDARRARVVWAGCSQSSGAFEALCANVRGALCALGFTFADEGIPHVTLARTRAAAALPATTIPSQVRVEAGAITLFDSVREKQTTRYVRVVRIPFGTGAGANAV